MSTSHSIPLHKWLGTWLTDAPRSPEGLPIISLMGDIGIGRRAKLPGRVGRWLWAEHKVVYVKGYLPKNGQVWVGR